MIQNISFLSYFLETLNHILSVYLPYTVAYILITSCWYVLIAAIIFYISYYFNYSSFFYMSCTTGFILSFFTRYKVLHFEHWLFIFALIYFSQIVIWSPLKSLVTKKLIGITIIGIALFSKASSIGLNQLINRLKSLLIECFKINSSIYIGLIIFLSLIQFYVISRMLTEASDKKKNKKDLFEEREGDKNFILNFLGVTKDGKVKKIREQEINVLGIEDNFGEGKTFLIEKVIEELPKKQFEVIKINCLLLDSEDVYPHIVKLLNKVLIKNNIYSGHLNKFISSVIKTIDNKHLGGLSSMFTGQNSIDDIENFKEAISTLNKRIVLIFDDFDRSSNLKKIEKLFSFIDDFSGKNIKSLVLYNIDNLKKTSQDKLNRDYIEKYIPKIMTLTKIDPENLLKASALENELNPDDFESLFSNTMRRNSNFPFKSLLDFGWNNTPKLNITPRKIQIFLQEVKFLLSFKELNIEKRTIIAFLFLKTFVYENFYEKISQTDFSFRKTFPLEIELLNSGLTISLEKLELFSTILEERAKIIISNKVKPSFKWGDYNIYFNTKFKEHPNHINNFLKELSIDTKVTNDSVEEFNRILDEISGTIVTSNMKISKNSSYNLLIYKLFNFPLFFRKDFYKIQEKNKKLEKEIIKLKAIGTLETLSENQEFYRKIKDYLHKDSYKNNSELFYRFLLWESIEFPLQRAPRRKQNLEEKTMIVLNIFGNEEEKKKFLEIILRHQNLGKTKEESKITNDYLLAFFTGNITDIEISDFIIQKFVEDKIQDLSNTTLIRENLSQILRRESFDLEDEYILDSNTDFYKRYIKYLENIKYKDFNFIKKFKNLETHIDNAIKFLNKLIELEKEPEYYNKKIPTASLESSLSQEAKYIKGLATVKERKNAFNNFFVEGMKLKKMKNLYDEIKDDI